METQLVRGHGRKSCVGVEPVCVCAYVCVCFCACSLQLRVYVYVCVCARGVVPV